MKVIKVLNNSLLFALDENGNETILMGKGIGFNKALGYKLEKEEIEKVFVIKDKNLSRNVIRLASEIDSTFFDIAKSLIDYAIETYNMKLTNHIYLSLTDHLSFAVKRIKKGMSIENFYVNEIKKFSPNEYNIGMYALNLLKEKFELDFPVDEAGNIAFHFINAQHESPYNKNNRIIIDSVKDILDIVKYNFILAYDEESLAYSRFVNHLRVFIQKIIENKKLEQKKDDSLFNEVIASCKEEYECVKKIRKYIKQNFNTELTTLEELYLTIHVHRILEEGLYINKSERSEEL